MSRNVPNVNASLIREVRMIVQQFLRSRENASFWAAWSPKPRASTTALKCGLCIRDRKPSPATAVAIVRGTTVCDEHAISIAWN